MKTFEVQEYVLPTFSVKVVAPLSVALSEIRWKQYLTSFPVFTNSCHLSFPVKITAEYTFGKAVQGSALVKFMRGSQIVYQRTVAVELAGAAFDVNINQDLGIQTQQSINIEVLFTEGATKKVSSATTTTTITKYQYSVGYASDYYNFVQNTPFNFKLAVRKFEGTSVSLILAGKHFYFNCCMSRLQQASLYRSTSVSRTVAITVRPDSMSAHQRFWSRKVIKLMSTESSTFKWIQ